MIDNMVDFIGLRNESDADIKFVNVSNHDNRHISGFLSLPEVKTIFRNKRKVEFINGKPFGVINKNPLKKGFNRFIKRFFDVFSSSLVLIFILSWLTPVLAILIKLDSRGPIFYRQKRSGRHNRTFYCLKFRTMTYDKNAEFKAATKNDRRVTNLGRFLRKTSIDEFAQFYNVFVGDMSIVGPRPHPLKLNEDFMNKVEKYMLRHVIKPGITGLAQAKGYRGEVFDTLTMKQRIKIDIFYIENWSFILDIKIILLTAYSVFRGDKNAY